MMSPEDLGRSTITSLQQPSSTISNKGSDRICGIVVTYHPVPEHLENLRILRAQVDWVIVIDNGSAPQELGPLRTLRDELGLVLIENQDNMGIAYALNQGVNWALEHRCQWINLFDQDSKITDGYIGLMIEDYVELSKLLPLGLLVPRYYFPAHGTEVIFRKNGYVGPFVTMTSGSLFSAEVLRKCGPFAEDLFIYVVDDEYSMRLRQKGFEIAQSVRAVMIHYPAAPRVVRALGRDLFRTTNHSAIARYYMNRNRIWLFRHYGRAYPKWFARLGLRTVKEALQVLIGEDQKWLKLTRILQGLRDGLLGRFGSAYILKSKKTPNS